MKEKTNNKKEIFIQVIPDGLEVPKTVVIGLTDEPPVANETTEIIQL